MSRILVTGASGFIGRRVVEILARSDNKVIAVSSREGQPDGPANNVRWRSLDLARSEFAENTFLRGCDAVVHLAGLAHTPNADAEDYHLLNVTVTHSLAEAAAKAGVRHFVFMSTAKVYGDGWPVTVQRNAYTESDKPDPQDDYAASKLRAEEQVADVAQQAGMCCTVLRPPLVYGPGVRANFLRLMSLVDRGFPLPLASVSNLRSLVYVENLAELICLLVQFNPEKSGIYNVADIDISTPDLIRRLADALSVRVRLFPLPPLLLDVAGKLTGLSSAVERLTQSLLIDSSRIRNDLGWVSPISPGEAMRRTAEWYKKTTSH